MITIHERLRAARAAAGFETAQDVCAAYDWKYSTYVGHENGSRGITTKAAARYASALRVSKNWLIFGVGEMSARSDSLPESPVAESMNAKHSVEEFHGKTASQTAAIKKLMEATVSDPKSGFLYTVKSAYLDFGLLPGDVLIAARGSDPKDGQIIIAIKADQAKAAGERQLFRWIGGQMVPSIQLDGAGVDRGGYSVVATVQCSIRISG